RAVRPPGRSARERSEHSVQASASRADQDGRSGRQDGAPVSALLDWHALYPERIHLVWIALAVCGLLLVLELRARGALSAFVSPVMQQRLAAQPTFTRTVVRLGFVLLALLAGVEALMRPQAPGQTESVTVSNASADVLFVLDVSR